jgi:hypothetical protein
MLCHVAVLRTDVSEEYVASITRVERSGELGTTLAVQLASVTLIMEAIHSSVTSFLARATWRNIPENGILHSHRRENLKFYTALTGWVL